MAIHTLPLIEGFKQLVESEKVKQCEGVNSIVNDKLMKGLEPETSGGLLLVIPAENADLFVQNLQSQNHKVFVIGDVVEDNGQENKVIIQDGVKIV